ncbi:MAG: hypothetical protein ACLVKI_04240 [Gordonibacter urolithinfaciens]
MDGAVIGFSDLSAEGVLRAKAIVGNDGLVRLLGHARRMMRRLSGPEGLPAFTEAHVRYKITDFGVVASRGTPRASY